MPGLEHFAIQKWGARAPLELSHRSLKSVHERTLFSAYWQAGPTCLWAKETARERAGDVSVRIELGEYSGEWAFLVSGLEAEHSLTASFWGAKMFVTSPRLKLDAQYLGIVRDDDFEQVTEEADSLRTEALEELAAQFLKTDKLKEHDRYASLLRYFTRLAAQEKAFSGLPALYNLKLFGEELTAREIIATLRERPYMLRMLSRDERAAIRECLANDGRSLRTGKGYQPFRIVSQKGRYALIDQDGRSGVFDPEIGEVLRISAQYGPTYLDETEHIFYEQFVAFEPFRIELRSVSLVGDKLWAPVPLEKTYTALLVGPERRYWLAVDGTVEELDSRGTVVWSLELPEWKGCLCHDDCFIIWNDDEWGAFDPEKRDWAYREPRAFPRVRSAGSFLVVDEVDEDLFSVFRLEDKSIEKLRTFQGKHSRLIDGFVIFTDDSGQRAFDLSGKLEEKAVFELLQAREAEVLAPSLHNDGPRSMAFVAGSLVWQSERGCGVLECSTGRTLFHSDSVFQTGFIQRGEENLARRVSSVLHLRTGRWTDVSRYFIQGSGWIGFCSPSGPCVGCAELEDFIPVEHLSAEIELANDQWLVRESHDSYQYKHHRDTEWTVLGNGSFIDVELLGSFALGRSREVIEAFELSSGRTVFRSQGILLGSDRHSLQFVVLERKRLVCITLGHPPTQELLPISNEEVRDWFDSFSKPYAPFLWSTNNARFLTPEVLALPHQ
ncbi:MAG: hypothetical protein KC800_17350, partial [Candidatus Eremiobacteraeota bacterium]|nr:hypothetical protein [Candidatus Eremiobacteraeota bacterium]